ncbi:MAG: hypothetical protein N838_13155 [Thiohalocapsa sp. PB-PSB1]|jgi:hypothetical protein|nr:MAG: hypothetical protein N838_13155 [Thiohalocapsa sp. PB-PSB1]
MTSTATLTRPQTELLQRRAAHRQMRARLIEKPHPEDATVGTPYYDEELDVAQSLAHHKTVQKLGELLDRVAAWEGLQSLGDNPVWYWDADEDCQRILYPDYALTDAENLGSVTAKSLLLAIEVVTTTHRRKEEKDTIKMRNWNELNAVPEFLLLYPEPDDPRGLIAYRYNKDQVAYENVPLGPRRRFVSQAIDGLVIEELAPDARSVGRKLRVFYRGEEVRDADAADRLALQEARARQQEARAREAADRRALQEAQARQQEAQAREAADRRVLQEAQARQQEAQAREAAEHHAAAAEQRAREEAQARMAAEQQAQRALALLEKAGIKLD